MEKQIADQVVVVIRHKTEEAQIWDRFVKQCPEGHIEQTNAWAQLRQCYGWKPIWLWVMRGERILGGAMILTRRVRRLATIGYVERGPIWNNGDYEAMNLVTNALYKLALSMRLTYLVVVPPYSGEHASPLLESLRFRRKPKTLPPTGVGEATLLIDLLKDQDALLADMSMTKRQNIRRAVRKGVRVRIGDGEDAELMQELMWIGCKRRGVKPMPPQKDFFQKLWDALGPAGEVKFFIAEVDGQPVSAATVYVFGDVMQLWRVGWSGMHEDCNPNDLLHWEMIKWAKENGCRVFDFLHIRPDHARAILRGKRVKDSYSGVTEFKTSFGGEIRLLPEIYYQSFNPFVQLALKFGAERLVETSACRNVLTRALSGG